MVTEGNIAENEDNAVKVQPKETPAAKPKVVYTIESILYSYQLVW